VLHTPFERDRCNGEHKTTAFQDWCRRPLYNSRKSSHRTSCEQSHHDQALFSQHAIWKPCPTSRPRPTFFTQKKNLGNTSTEIDHFR
jgi:hypothetical protein